MIVCDTSVLSYLVPMGLAENLVRRYGVVAIPQTVLEELSHPGAPVEVREWLVVPPDWLRVRPNVITSNAVSLAISGLDAGEREAIHLALALAVPILLDDAAGRRTALDLGLEFSGTVGFIALEAADRRLDFDQTVERLQDRGFHVASEVINRLRPRG